MQWGYSWGTGPRGGPPRSVGVPSKKGAEGTNGVESGGECGGGLLSSRELEGGR